MVNILKGNYEPDVKFKNPSRPTYEESLVFFKAYLKKLPYMTPEDLENLDHYMEYFSMSKNHPIVLPGDICRYIVFICQGAVKHYTEDPKGKYIVSFSTKGYFCSALYSFLHEVESRDGLFCVENTIGLQISLPKFKQLKEKSPAFKRLFRDINYEGIVRMANRLKSFQTCDARGRYELLMEEHSSVFNHFSMQDISNYLGIKPESLSRLRRDKGNQP